MTKDEFLSMLNRELENLEKEYNSTLNRVEYFRQINPNGKEFEEAKYQFEMVKQRIDMLKKLIGLPAYARIQAMSDIEIEDYKKIKVEELQLKIKEIKAKEEQAKAKLSQLKAEQEQLISQFALLSDNERDIAIHRGQQLSEEIRSYDTNNRWGIFAQLQTEIAEIKRQQEQINAMTSQEVKQQLSSEIKGNLGLAQTIKWAKEPIDASTQLQASVSSDPQKAQQMANLLVYYNNLSASQSNIKGSLFFGFYELPQLLRKRVANHSYYYNPDKSKLTNPDKLLELVAEFEEIFKQAKEEFNAQFTEQKLFNLVGILGEMSSEVDIEFLQQHADKIGDGKLSHLESLVEQRNILSKKIFKTREIKHKIEILNEQIKMEQAAIYSEIIGWYASQSRDTLGLGYGISQYDFHSLEALKHALELCRSDIDNAEQKIAEFKEAIKAAKAQMEIEKQGYEARKAEVAQQIRALGGKENEEIKIPYASDNRDYNLGDIVNASSRVYQSDVVNKVQQEAQNQADIREAELRGVSLEELREMKQQPKR